MQHIYFPLEVDILLIGLEGDGAFHYRMDGNELEELLSTSLHGRELCPTIWDTGKPASICYNVDYVTFRSELGDVSGAWPWPMLCLHAGQHSLETGCLRPFARDCTRTSFNMHVNCSLTV